MNWEYHSYIDTFYRCKSNISSTAIDLLALTYAYNFSAQSFTLLAIKNVVSTSFYDGTQY